MNTFTPLKCAVVDLFGVRSLVDHNGDLCECFGGGCWDIDQRTGEVGDRRSRIPDYDERRLEYAAEDEEHYYDGLFEQNLHHADAKEVRHSTPLTRKEKHGRAEKKRQDEISALQCNCDNMCYDPARDARVRKENRAKKHFLGQREPLKAIASALEVEQRAITLPEHLYSKWLTGYHMSQDEDDDFCGCGSCWCPHHTCQGKNIIDGDHYWAKRGFGARFDLSLWSSYGTYTRNFKAERYRARLEVQRRKVLCWHWILVDYFPQFLPLVVHTSLLSNARWKVSTKSAEVDEPLKAQTVRVSDRGYVIKKANPDQLAELTKSVEYWQWRVEFYEQTLATRRD